MDLPALAGTEVEKSIPDFVAVKVLPQLNGVREHRIVCVVEMKLVSYTEPEAVEQMLRYMTRIADLPDRDENLRGYLVAGRRIKPYRLQRGLAGVEVRIGAWFDMFAVGDRLTTELCQIAVRNWN